MYNSGRFNGQFIGLHRLTVWFGGNALVSINEDVLRWARSARCRTSYQVPDYLAWPSLRGQAQWVPTEAGGKQAHHVMHTCPYPWCRRRSVIWCRAEGYLNGDRRSRVREAHLRRVRDDALYKFTGFNRCRKFLRSKPDIPFTAMQ